MNTQRLLSLHLAVLLFGASGLIGKIVTSPALVVACARSLIASLVLAAFLAARGGWQGGAFRAQAGPLLVAGALLAAHWWAFFEAIQRGTVALGLLTFASYPMFATLLGRALLRERIGPWDAVACVLVMLGLLLVVPDWRFGSHAASATMFGVFSGFTFSLLTLVNRRLITTLPALGLVAAQTGVAGLLLFPAALARLPAVPARDWLWLILLGVVFTGLAHACFISALRGVRVTTAGVTAALEPVYGICFAGLFIAERPSTLMLLGGGIILAGSLLGAWRAVSAGKA